MSAALPQNLGSYRLERLVGRGGMGEVYLAWDRDLQRSVAIKVIRAEYLDDDDRRRRLIREARTVAQLNHAGIVHLYHLMPCGESQALVMEWVEGETLRSLLRRRGPLPLGSALPLFQQLCEALAYAHRAGFVHRDLKPENVMITAGGQAKILDFGLAKSLRPATAISDTGQLIGTFSFMSPEQTSGLEVGPASDLFSLGVVFYETLTGVSPFGGETAAETLNRICYVAHPEVRQAGVEIPEALASLIDRMLEKTAERRPGSAEEVSRALLDLMDSASQADTWQAPVAPGAQEARVGEKSAAPSAVGAETLVESMPTMEDGPGASDAAARDERSRGLLAVRVALLVTFVFAVWIAARSVPPQATSFCFTGFEAGSAGDQGARALVWNDAVRLTLEAFDGVPIRRLGAEMGEMSDPARLRREYGVGQLLLGELGRGPSSWRLEIRLAGTQERWSLERSAPPSAHEIVEWIAGVRPNLGAPALTPAQVEMLRAVWPEIPEAEEWLGEGMQSAAQSDLRRAERIFDRAVRDWPDHPALRLAQARALHQLGQVSRARETAEIARELSGSWPASLREPWFAPALEALGNAAESAAGWRRLAQRYPDRADYRISQADALIAAGDYPGAREVLGALPARLPREDQRHRQAQMARAWLGSGQAEEALTGARALLADEALPARWQGRAWWIEGTALERLGRLEEALAALDRARASFELDDNRAGLLDVFVEMGIVVARQGRLDEARAHFSRYAETYRRQGDPAAAAIVEANLATVLIRMAQPLEAIPLLRAALEELRRSGRPADIASVAINLGAAEHQLGALDAAEQAYREALDALEQSGDARSLAVVHTNLGEVLLLRGYPERAAEMHRLALAANAELDPAGAVYDRLRLAEALRHSGEAESSRQLFERLLAAPEELGDPVLLAEARLGLSGVHLDLHNLGEAERLAGLAEEAFWQAEQNDLAVRAQLVRTFVAGLRGEETAAADLLRTAGFHAEVSASPALTLEVAMAALRLRFLDASPPAREAACEEGRSLEARAEEAGLGLLVYELRQWRGESCFLVGSEQRWQFLEALAARTGERGLGRILERVNASLRRSGRSAA